MVLKIGKYLDQTLRQIQFEALPTRNWLQRFFKEMVFSLFSYVVFIAVSFGSFSVCPPFFLGTSWN